MDKDGQGWTRMDKNPDRNYTKRTRKQQIYRSKLRLKPLNSASEHRAGEIKVTANEWKLKQGQLFHIRIKAIKLWTTSSEADYNRGM